jgi:homoserine O-acetyltransferase/O-succinyltransferase
MDLFDLTEGYPSVKEALKNLKCPILIMGSQTDLLFPVKQQREIAKSVKDSGKLFYNY